MANFCLKGKVALITGASGAIGCAIATKLAEDGYDPQTAISYARAHDLLVVDGINRNNNKTFRFEGITQKGYAFKLPNVEQNDDAQDEQEEEMPF